jgi:protease-4
MNGLFEILSNKEWMIQQEFLHSILPTLQYNITNHASLGIDREKKSPMAIGQQGQDFIREYQVTQDGKTHGRYGWRGDSLSELNEPFVNVMPIDGPITRNGGACSYGSMEIRDWMMEAANNPSCQGHVLNINTPGGSAWAKNDFQQGIEYAHSKGQRVIAFIDGLCASAGMYLASLCDEVYVMNPKDQLGCVGVMAAFFTMKNGDKDLSTGETYREYYDPESVDKNKEMRDIAEDEDATLLIEELKTLGEEFRADMKAAFPNAKDEHLKGKIFDAKDVMGILCDGQMMLGDVISRVFNLANGTEQPIARTASRKIAKRQKSTAPVASASGTVPAGSASGKSATILSNKNNNTIMKEQFPALFAALGVEEMQMQEDGAFVNTDLLATLNAAIEAKEKAAADAQALVESLTTEKNELTAKVETLNADIEAKNLEIATLTENAGKADETLKAKDDEIAALNTDIQSKQAAIDGAKAEMEQKDATIATLNATITQKEIDFKAKEDALTAAQTELAGAKESLTTAEQTLAERDQQITDLNAQLTELQNNPGAEPAAGAAPQNNGGGAEAPEIAVNQYVYDPALSYKENRELEAKWNAEHGKA